VAGSGSAPSATPPVPVPLVTQNPDCIPCLHLSAQRCASALRRAGMDLPEFTYSVETVVARARL